MNEKMEITKETKCVSIIVPCYNAERYVEECVRSICNQDYDKLDIILVDDGSTDSTKEKLDFFAAHDNRIRVFHEKNGGVAVARNVGLLNCIGDYVIFVDADDIIPDNSVSILLSYAISEDADVVLGGFTSFYDCDVNKGVLWGISVSKEYESERDYFLDVFKNKMPWLEGIAIWGKIYKKEIFSDLLFPEGYLCEDAYIMLDIVLRSKRILSIVENCYFYRIRNDSVSHSFSAKYIKDNLAWMNRYLSFFENRNDEQMVVLLCQKMAHDIRSQYKYAEKDIKDLLKKYYSKARKCILGSRYADLETKMKYFAYKLPR